MKDGADTIGRQLEALEAQEADVEWDLVIADNGSTDGTRDVVAPFVARHDRWRVVDASARPGSAPTRNAAVAASEGELVVGCEADDVVQPGWLAAMVEAAPRGHLLGGFIDSGPLNDDLTRAWRIVVPSAASLPRPLGFLPIAVGANCAVWRHVLDEAGGWNESYRTQTDVELSWRLQLAGYHLEPVPDAVVHYSLRTTLDAVSRQSFNEGRGHAQLYRDFRDAGAKGKRTRSLVRNVGWLLWHVRDRNGPPERAGVWRRRAGHQRGRLAGSREFHVWFP